MTSVTIMNKKIEASQLTFKITLCTPLLSSMIGTEKTEGEGAEETPAKSASEVEL